MAAWHQPQYVNSSRWDPVGDPLARPATSRFILWEEQRLVTDYEAIEVVNEPPFVGFALCRINAPGELLRPRKRRCRTA